MLKTANTLRLIWDMLCSNPKIKCRANKMARDYYVADGKCCITLCSSVSPFVYTLCTRRILVVLYGLQKVRMQFCNVSKRVVYYETVTTFPKGHQSFSWVPKITMILLVTFRGWSHLTNQFWSFIMSLWRRLTARRTILSYLGLIWTQH